MPPVSADLAQVAARAADLAAEPDSAAGPEVVLEAAVRAEAVKVPGRGGVQPVFGLARLARQRANRIRISLTNDYSNSALNARPYNLAGGDSPKVDSWQEGFGASLGGPLRIPKLYDGSDRTFFFVNYNLNRGRTAVDQFSTVPTLAERQGDFSDRGAQLYDPFSNLSGPRTSWGSAIPSGMLDPAAVGLLQYIPEPNLPGLVQNFHLQDRIPSATDRLNVRVQHTLSSVFHLDVAYSLQEGRSHAFTSFPAFERDTTTRGQSVTLALTQNWSPTFSNSTQFFYTRNRNLSLNQFAFVQDVAGSLGITGVSSNPIDYGVPQLNFTNFTDASDPVPSLIRNQTFRFADTIRVQRVRHTITSGFEVRRMENNAISNPTPRGSFTFSGELTSQLDATGVPVTGTGLDFADFLLGLPSATNVRFGTPSTYFRSWAYAGFVNDDWRVAPSLSLNYGLRYEAITPSSEEYGHIANLDVSPDFTQAAVVVPGQVAPFNGELPAALVRGDYNNWSPRIGIAWRPPFDQRAHGARRIQPDVQRGRVQSLRLVHGQPASLGAGANTFQRRNAGAYSARWLSGHVAKYAAQHHRRRSQLPAGVRADVESVGGHDSDPQHAHRRDLHRHQRHAPGHAAGLQRQQHPGQRRRDSECSGIHLQHLRRQLHLSRRAIPHTGPSLALYALWRQLHAGQVPGQRQLHRRRPADHRAGQRKPGGRARPFFLRRAAPIPRQLQLRPALWRAAAICARRLDQCRAGRLVADQHREYSQRTAIHGARFRFGVRDLAGRVFGARRSDWRPFPACRTCAPCSNFSIRPLSFCPQADAPATPRGIRLSDRAHSR